MAVLNYVLAGERKPREWIFYSTAVDIEDTAKKSKDQSCISTGTENNSCSDKCGGILEKRTDQCTCKEAGNCPSDYQKRKKNGCGSMFLCMFFNMIP